MTLTPGTRIGSYEIVSKLGEGGMGEVFRARDTKLGRDVAAKVLPASFAQDASRLARFQREARTLASLNHPNVAQVFGLEDGAAGGDEPGHGPVLIMELLDGHSLTDLLASGPLPVRKAVDYAGQIARGLAAAHDRGIIHRDLKPDNLFVLPDGRVKILDFGLARQIETASADPSDPDATRVHDLRTEPGMVMGTVGYMAPEQVRADATDARSDLFSLGLVLFEMLTGQRAFRRGTMAETMTAILREDPPDLASLRPETNPGLVRVVHRLLEKSPAARFQTGSDLAFALEHLSGSAPGSGATTVTPSTETGPPVPSAPGTDREQRKNRSPLRTFGWVAVGLLAAGSSVLFNRFMPDDDEAVVETAPPAYRASVVFPEGVKVTELGAPAVRLAMSPDGTKVAFIGAARGEQRPPDRLWVMTLADGAVRELEGTIGARSPFWSPDSQQLGFSDVGAGVTKRIALSGGQATVIAPFPGNGAWAPDGTILVVELPPGNRVAMTTASSATPPSIALTGTEGKVVGFPVFLADRRRFLFSMAESRTGPGAIHLGTPGGSAASAPKVIEREEALNTRLANGYVLFTDGPMLLAQRFDQTSGTVSGPVVTLADDVTYTLNAGGAFSASDTGALAYVPKPFQSNSRLVWMDRAGNPVSTLADAADYSNLVLSPDGRRAVTSVMDPVRRARDIYIVDVERGVRQRLTFDPADERSAIWSADGRRIIYHKGGDLFARASDFGGAEAPVQASVRSKDPQQVSADGTRLLYRQSGAGNDLWQMSLVGEPAPTAVVNSPFDENYGNYSPDGRSMVFASNESGRPEVYVLPLDGSGGRTIVSTDGGSFPRWRRDGKEIVYQRPDQTLMAVSVSGSGASLKAGTPTPLFRVATQPGAGNPFDVSADGQHFLVNTMLPPRMPPSLTVIVNWPTLAAQQQSPQP